MFCNFFTLVLFLLIPIVVLVSTTLQRFALLNLHQNVRIVNRRQRHKSATDALRVQRRTREFECCVSNGWKVGGVFFVYCYWFKYQHRLRMTFASCVCVCVCYCDVLNAFECLWKVSRYICYAWCSRRLINGMQLAVIHRSKLYFNESYIVYATRFSVV